MEVTIIRREDLINRNGADEVFIVVEINHDELGIFHYPKWLKGQNAVQFKSNESFFEAIKYTIAEEAIAFKISQNEQSQSEQND